MFKHSLTVLALALAALPMVASATTKTFTVTMMGSNEVPANASLASGTFTLTVDDTLDTLTFGLAALNLAGTFSAAHIHAAAAGVNGGVVFNLVTNADTTGPLMFGPITFPNSYGISGSNKAAPGSLADMINAAPWNYYVNLHTSAFGGGEIRAQLAPIPEPATYALLAMGLGLVGVAARRRRVG